MSLDRREVPRATFVLPVYNAQNFIASTLRRVHDWLRERPEPWELIVVDDASSDGTPALIEAFAAGHPGDAIRCVRFAANRGKGFATRTGLGLARGAWVLFTDCDLAYPLENAEGVMSELAAGADAVIACRVLPSSTYLISPSFFSYLYTRHLMGRAFNLICRALTVPRLLDTQAGLKGFRASVIQPLLGALIMDGFSFDVELLRALQDRGARIVEMPVTYRYDTEPSTVRFIIDSLEMARDLAHVRVRSFLGRYRAPARTAPPPGRLVVHADDFGLAPGINQAIQEGFQAGSITSASILLGGPHAEPAVAWAAGHPQFDYGVHLNLTQGRPILPAAQVPSLVDREGRFLGLGRFLARFVTGRVRTHQVRQEWRAQIEAVRRAGVAVSHLDSHQHVHLLPRLFRKTALRIARHEGVPLRVMDGPVRRRVLAPDFRGLMLAVATRVCARPAGLDGACAHGFGTSLMRRPTVGNVRTLLARARPGRTYEMVVHPGVPDGALADSGDGYVRGRELERRLISSEEFRAVVRNAGFELVPLGRAPLPAAPPAGDRVHAG